MERAIETEGLARRFGRQEAVRGVDLHVPQRAVYGFLGQNGAGKTTTIRMLLSLLRPTAGVARLFGHDVARERIRAARLIGSLVETPCHYDHLTGRENLRLTARLLRTAVSEIDRVLELVELASAADRRVGGYSLGMRQRLGVARALLGRPKLLILDEPTNGLDPQGILDMRRLISTLPETEGVTVFVSSHVLAEVEQTATHVGLMHEGRLLLEADSKSLKAQGRRRVVLTVDRTDLALGVLREKGIHGIAAGRDRIVIKGPSAEAASREIASINALLVTLGVQVSGVEVREPTLEEIFHRAIEEAGGSETPLPLAA
ncbi:MAG TPA: ATP-binding cassette domain-containing protein [Allosphingosinicella sp.]|jgi:ABC-2 type transport system ATP-binding protein